MAWTQENLDDLKAAIAEGVTSVAYRDRTVVYRSLDEMLRTKDLIESELSSSSAATERVQRVSFDKGYQ